MAKEIEAPRDEKKDPVEYFIDTPKEKLRQLSIVPTGGVSIFSIALTNAQIGKKDAFDGKRPIEYFIDTNLELSRSKQGVTLLGLMKIAQTKVEVSAEEQSVGKKIAF
jgi:hypothetical protein